MPDQVTVQVVGCGDAFGSGGRFQSCYLLKDAHGTMAIDFGATSPVALRMGGHDPYEIDVVLLSHFHGDHFGGLPVMLLDREFNAPHSRPLVIAGPPGLRERLGTLMEAMFPGTWRKEWRFPLHLVEIVPGGPVDLSGRIVLSRKVNHPTGAYDATALRIETGGKVLAYSGDTGWVDALREISQDSDLFICECYEHQVKPYEGHMAWPVLREHLASVQSRRIVITHLGPDMVAALAEIPVESLRDGSIYQL